MRPASAAALGALCLLAALSWARPASAEDAKVEAAAQEALTKAQADYEGKALGKALYRLGKALHACGKTQCSDATVAALVRDIGAIHARQKDKKGALKLFTRAVGLSGALELNPAYDTPDVRALWEEAGGKKKPEPAPPPPAPAAPPPPAAFAHQAPIEQAADTPLPIYVEGDTAVIARVVLEYGPPAAPGAAPAWKEVVLDRVGSGWGGAVPCSDVTVGTLRYFVEGFGAGGVKAAVSGDAEHPHEVAVKPSITSEAPHLPGQAAPTSCAKAAPEPVAEAHEPAPAGTAETAGPHRRRWWVGVAGNMDFMSVPSGDDLCIRNAATERPANGDNLYCTTLDGADFPPAAIIHGTLGDIVPGQGQGGHSDGGLQLGDVRYMVSVDYALTSNALVGGRLGVITNRYQGHDAVRDNRAFGGTPLHVELRASWVFGRDPLMHSWIAPVVFVAGGVSEFDAQVQSTVTVTQGTPPTQSHLPVPVNIWKTDGPGFVGAGAGLRIAIGEFFAVTPAIRGNLAFGFNGVVPLFDPELSLQIGF